MPFLLLSTVFHTRVRGGWRDPAGRGEGLLGLSCASQARKLRTHHSAAESGHTRGGHVPGRRARTDVRAQQAGKPRFAAPVPLRREVTATPRLKMDIFKRKMLSRGPDPAKSLRQKTWFPVQSRHFSRAGPASGVRSFHGNHDF